MFKDQTKLNGDAIKVKRVAFIVGNSELYPFQIFVRDVNVVRMQRSRIIIYDSAQLAINQNLFND